VLQLNVEGLTTAKLEVVRHLADSNGAAAVLLQETHCTSDNILKIPGFHVAGSIHSKQHGVATFVRTEISWSTSSQSPPGTNIEWLVTKNPGNISNQRIQAPTIRAVCDDTPVSNCTCHLCR